MKKYYVLLIALALMFALASTATAQTGIELIQSGSNHWLVSGTELLDYYENGCFGLRDLEGNILTEAKYTSSFYASGNLLICSDETGGTGALLHDGSTIIPFRYGNVQYIESGWAAGFVCEPGTDADHDTYDLNGNPVKNVSVDLYFLESGACVGTLTAEQFSSAYGFANCINIQDGAGTIACYDTEFNVLDANVDSLYSSDYAVSERINFYENSLCGWKDAEGNVILAPTYDDISTCRYGYALVQKGEGIGVIDAHGNLVLEPVYDYVNSMYGGPLNEDGSANTYCINGYFSIDMDSKLGFADGQGITCEPKYAYYDVDENGLSLVYTDESGNTWLLAADGVETQVTEYSDFYPVYCMGGVYYEVYDDAGNAGLIDWHGNEILPCEYAYFIVSDSGKYLCAVKSDFSTVNLYKVSYPQGAPLAGAPADAAGAAVEISAAAVDAPAETQPAEETGASESVVLSTLRSLLGSLVPDAAPAETPEPVPTPEPTATPEPVATQAPAEVPAETPVPAPAAAAADVNTVKALFESAALLLNTDAATNGAGALSLITTAQTLLGDSNLSVSTLLDTAVNLLNADAAANGAAVASILVSAAALL